MKGWGITVIEARTKKVFYSQTANRHYFTKLAAIKAEARALLIKKHPTESAENEPEIGHYYPGWHWTELKRSDVLYRRVMRMVKNASSPNV
jgi:hypothetical protein